MSAIFLRCAGKGLPQVNTPSDRIKKKKNKNRKIRSMGQKIQGNDWPVVYAGINVANERKL
jgi:hypothetical protein